MREIIIQEDIKSLCPHISLSCLEAKVQVEESTPELWNKVQEACEQILRLKEVTEIAKLENIKRAREAYRALGQDPTRYRVASEALLRRVLKGKGLYQVNNVVDINNLISIKYHQPVCTYDLSQLKGSIKLSIGKSGESYEGIGRGIINIENIPVFSDDAGNFGSTTSDSERAKVSQDTKHILMIIVSFQKDLNRVKYMEEAKELLKGYAGTKEVETKVIE